MAVLTLTDDRDVGPARTVSRLEPARALHRRSILTVRRWRRLSPAFSFASMKKGPGLKKGGQRNARTGARTYGQVAVSTVRICLSKHTNIMRALSRTPRLAPRGPGEHGQSPKDMSVCAHCIVHSSFRFFDATISTISSAVSRLTV